MGDGAGKKGREIEDYLKRIKTYFLPLNKLNGNILERKACYKSNNPTGSSATFFFFNLVCHHCVHGSKFYSVSQYRKI